MKIVEFKDYDNQTTPLSAYNLNRLQQNLITTKYQMTFSSAVSGGSTITLPCYYQVGQDTLDVYLNSELLKKASTKDSEGHYYEVGNSDTKSNQIKITSDWSIASGDVLNLIVRGTTDSYDQNLSPDKATQLADEISANKEEITNLKNENSYLQKVIDQLPQVTGQGTSITLENTIEAQFTKFEIKGNSTQDGTPSPDYPSEVKSCGDNINIFDGEVEEGNIDASTGQNTVVTNAWRSKNYLNVKDTSVSISVKDLTFSGTVGRLYFYKSDNTYISNILINSLPFTATLPNETAKVRFFILNSVADINAKIKLEKGSTVTPYSPYGQGCINEVVFNIQMFNKANEIVGQLINSSGVVSTNENWNTSEYISVKKGSTICWSYETVGAGQLTINEFNDAKSFIKQTYADYRNNNGNELVVTLSNDTSYVRVGYRNDLTCDNLVLEYGNKRSGSREYKEPQTYTIPTQQPFRSIGDVRDLFFKNVKGSKYYNKDLQENKWYERHPIHRLILTGDEEWNMLPTSLFQLPNIPVSIARSGGLCNRYRYNSSQSNLNNTLRYGEFAIQVLANGTYLYFKNTDFTDTESFKADLKAKYEAGTPVYVDYLLAGPLNLPCTETQIQQLENKPSTYKEMTIINSEDETEAYLEVSGIYDLNNLINNFIRKEI